MSSSDFEDFGLSVNTGGQAGLGVGTRGKCKKGEAKNGDLVELEVLVRHSYVAVEWEKLGSHVSTRMRNSGCNTGRSQRVICKAVLIEAM